MSADSGTFETEDLGQGRVVILFAWGKLLLLAALSTLVVLKLSGESGR